MKRTLSLLLVLLLTLALFAGCSSGENTDPSSSPSASPSLTPAPTGDNSDPDSLISLPLVNDVVNYEIWAMNQCTSYGVQDFNDQEAFQALEERTNVHIDWILPPQSDYQTSFQLLLAGQELPDSFMLYYTMLPGGLDAAIEDENITDITDLVTEYCPNYYAQISEGDMWLGARTDSGKMPGFFGIKRTVQPNYGGPIARKDMMDNFGIEIPYTLDEFHDMLAAFRDNGVEVPTTITNTGLAGQFMAAFDLHTGQYGHWYQIDGVVQYAPIQDAFLDYLTLMNQWYSEGLIDPDFFTLSGTDAKSFDTAYTLTGRIAVWNATYQTIHSNMVTAELSGDTTYELVAIPFPMQNEGDTRHVGSTSQERWQGNIGTISPQVEDKVTLARWYDYLFSEEGWILSSYGAGSAYFIDEEGHPRGNELIYANPDSLSPYQAMNFYSMSPDIPTLYDWERELLVTMNDNALAAFDVWNFNDDNAYALPSMIFPTTEESTRFSAIMGDVDTYISEIVVKFITGAEPLSSFETFRENIYNLGIEEAIQIKQAGYDRYLAR